MGFFITPNAINESALAGIDVNESIHEAGIKGAYACIAESEINYTNMMKAFGIMELTMVDKQSDKTEALYEAADAKGFFGKIKAFFVSIWEKVKALYKRFIMTIDSMIKSDAEFVRTHRDAILKASTKDFKYQGFKYTQDAVEVKPDVLDSVATGKDANLSLDKAKDFAAKAATATFDGGSSEATKVHELVAAKSEEITEEMRGKAVGGGKLTVTEFDEELFKKLRNGESTRVEIETVDPHSLLDTISNFKKAKKTAEDGMKAIEKKINDNIKAVEKLEADVVKLSPGKTDAERTLGTARAEVVKYTAAVVSIERTKLNILQTVNGYKMSALKEEYRTAKSLCTALVAHRPVKEATENSGSGSFLDNVKFI